MKRIAIILLALLTPLLAQQETIRKVVEVKYRRGCKIVELVLARDVSVHCEDRMIVLTGPPERVADTEAAIRKFDVTPPDEKNVEILAYLVLASNDAATGPSPPTWPQPSSRCDRFSATKAIACSTRCGYPSGRPADSIRRAWRRRRSGSSQAMFQPTRSHQISYRFN
jgi:hypothetical protein